MTLHSILIISFVLLAIGLFTFKQEKYLRLCAIASACIVALLLVLATLLNNNFSYSIISYQDFVNFNFPIYSMAVMFGVAFILSVTFLLIHKKIHYKELAIILIYFVGATGILVANDIFSLLIYWELVALSGSLIVNFSLHPHAANTALKYFTIHAISGVCLMIGLIDYSITYSTSSLPHTTFSLSDPMNYFLLLGILINLGLPPVASWVVDGYSKCSSNASLFLSIFTTKSALFLLLRFFYGNHQLIYIGILIALYGMIFSAFQTNIRRILAYSIIHQIGLTIIGISAVAYSNGLIISYIIVGVLYKLVFFMVAALLFDITKTEDIYKLKGAINIKSMLGVVIIITALQSLGLPFTGGFIVKSSLLDDITQMSLTWLDYTMLLAMAGTALNIGVRLPYYLLNFKNNSKVNFKQRGLNNKIILPLLIIVVLLQAIAFIHFTQFTNLANITHALEVFGLGFILFYIGYHLINEEALLKVINNSIVLLHQSTISFLRLFTSTVVLKALNRSAVSTYTYLVSLQFNYNILTSRIIYLILVFMCLIYMVIKWHS
ncbi:NAD(P)H-quinone oxidoreductase subunit 2 [Candidatus Hepatincola sp. Av]